MFAAMLQQPAEQVFVARMGWQVREGGWVYSATGRPVCHGWAALADWLRLLGWVRAGVVLWDRVPDSARDGLRPLL
jgi:hypothetical protein